MPYRSVVIPCWESLNSLSPDKCLERLTDVHNKYVMCGSYSVTSHIGEDLGIGIGIARKRDRKVNIQWPAADTFSLLGTTKDFPATCNITEVKNKGATHEIFDLHDVAGSRKVLGSA
jgi:hypothetical protein